MSTSRFRSRVDAGLVMLIVGTYAGVFGFLASQARSTEHVVLFVCVFVVSSWLPAWIFLQTSYALTATALEITCGPISDSIPLASIRRVRRTRSLLSAPALSMRRLALEHGQSNTAVISPKDEAEFIAALVARVPALEVDSALHVVPRTAG